ncbi:helix-turn-helix domain-containing protein [Fructilactobacillus vespulae]|uniref:helix-turn-helix domain-containing protein n=1 Tax=Fructilactobacillus vespulae TaxID=1249630 RepID=UPI0039B63A34
MPRINYEVKNKIIEEYFNGIGSTTLSQKYHVSKSVILVWINRIKNKNLSMISCKNRHQIEYSLEFKIKVLKYKNSNNSTLSELCNKFKIHSESTIYFWQHQFDELGIIGLSRKRGNPKMTKNKITKQTKLSKDERLKQLEEENLMLRIQNEYLKKLKALDQKQTKKK